jgi:hypothetical protein
MNLSTGLVSILILPLGLVALHAGTSDDKELAPPVVGPIVASPFYAEINGGVVFLNTPRKNNDNLYTDVGAEGVNGKDDATGNFETNSIGGSLGGKFGYILETHPDATWLGTNLRVEGTVNYFASGTSGLGHYASFGVPGPDNAYWIQALNGAGGAFIGVFQDSPRVHESTSDYFYQGGAAVKSDFSLMHGLIVITPSVGLDYSHLGQHFDTSATGNAGFFDQAEKIDTDYYGFDFGVEATMHFTRQLYGSFATGITPLIASSSYRGNQSVGSVSGSDNSSAGDNTSLLTFRTNADASLCYDFGPVILKLSGGVQYWDYAAAVAEAKLPVGSEVGSPGGSSHLVSSGMLNPEVNGAIIVPF